MPRRSAFPLQAALPGTATRTGAPAAGLRGFLSLAMLMLAAFVLSACDGSRFASLGTPQAPIEQPSFGEEGGNRIALLLPLSASGNAGRTAESLKNAAEMAMSDLAATNVQLVIKDTTGTPSGAQNAASEAMAEGARIILGPLFAQNVQAIRSIASANNVPIIAFSSDANVAGPGVYLLSFLPEAEVERIAGYAAEQGRESAALLLPDNAYGLIAESTFRQVAGQRGMRIVAVERYASNSEAMQGAARRIAAAATRASTRADTVFAPAVDAPQLAGIMAENGYTPDAAQLVGTGQWDVPETYRQPAMRGGWFAAPDPSGWRSFRERYRGRFGNDPVRIATLSYDAVRLAAELTKDANTAPVPRQAITTRRGFAGIDGIFRFRENGTNERGLAVMQVTANGPEVISPAPRTWGGAAPATASRQ